MLTKKLFKYILKFKKLVSKPKFKIRLKKLKVGKYPFSLGLALLIFGGFLLVGNGVNKNKAAYTFATEPVKIEGFNQIKNQEGTEEPVKIIIPKAGIDLPVKRSEVINGYWEVFQDTAGWGIGSGFPGKIGNQVIFAHAREGLFLPLNKLKKNDRIYVHTKSSWFSYYVIDIKSVAPNQLEVIAPTQDETLTLYTCSGYKDSSRLIIVAKREDPLF